MATPVVVVDQSDLETLIGRFKGKGLIPSTRLYEAYQRIARTSGHPVQSRTALGRALTSIGGKRVVLRTARGRRGQQSFTETHCWELPEGGTFTDRDAQVVSVLREMAPPGDGVDYLPGDRVWDAYEEAARRQGWVRPMSRPVLSRWMTQHGFLSQQFRHRQCWLISRPKLDRICPPLT
jgi:hypothetical protein